MRTVEPEPTSTPSATTRRAANAGAARPYYVNFGVDAFFIGIGSTICFLVLRLGSDYGGWSDLRTATVINWGIWLSWVVNWPHFAATSYRLYRSRETVSQYPVTAFVVPLILLPATIAALSMPDDFAPWFVKLFMIWSPYHFSGQTIGIAMLYARRAGFQLTPLLRWALTWFVFSTYLGLQAASEVPGVVHSFYGITDIPTLGIPDRFVTVTHWATIALGAVLLYAAFDASVLKGHKFPVIMAVPVITQLIWFKLAVGTFETASFLEFVPLFHSLQYLFIAWFMQMKERQLATGELGRRRTVLRETIVWGTVIFIVGAIMFSWGPWLAALLFPVSIGVATGVLQSTVQIHHFFVDGVIWKLRNPRVSAALNTSLDELIHAPRAADP